MRLPGETNRLLAVGVDSPGRYSEKHVNEDAGVHPKMHCGKRTSEARGNVRKYYK